MIHVDRERFFKSAVRCCVFSDWSSHLRQINKRESHIWYMACLCCMITWTWVLVSTLLTCPHLLWQPDFWRKYNLTFFRVAPCSIRLIYSQKWFICLKNWSCRWSLPSCTSAGASERECCLGCCFDFFWAGRPLLPLVPCWVLETRFRLGGSCGCSIFTAESLSGCVLLPFVVLFCFVQVETRESDVCCSSAVACRRDGEKMPQQLSSSRTLELCRLMSCHKVVVSTCTQRDRSSHDKIPLFPDSGGFSYCLDKCCTGNRGVMHKEDSRSVKVGLTWKTWPRTDSTLLLMSKECREYL